jgi:hypothetical protein
MGSVAGRTQSLGYQVPDVLPQARVTMYPAFALHLPPIKRSAASPSQSTDTIITVLLIAADIVDDNAGDFRLLT